MGLRDENTALYWQFHTGVTDVYPTDTSFSLNDADADLATFMNVDELSEPSLLVSGILDDWLVNGHILLRGTSKKTNAILYKITGAIIKVDAGGGNFYYKIPIVKEGSETQLAFADDEEVGFTYFCPIAAAAGGTWVPAEYTHDVATADADPGSGLQRFNNLTYGSITEVYISDISKNGNDLTVIYEGLLAGDILYFQQGDDSNKFVALQISGALVDNTTYFTIPVTVLDSGTNIDDAAEIGIIFYRAPVVEFKDNQFRIVDDVDGTKKLAFQVSTISPATLRTITVPDEDLSLISPEFTNLTINGQSNSPYESLSAAAASIPSDMNNGAKKKVTLTTNGPYTLANPTNLKDGADYVWRVQQDGTGTRLLAYGSVFKWSGGSAPVLSTSANAVDLISCVCDGTDIICGIIKDVK